MQSLLIALLCLVASSRVFSQVNTATVYGNVQDPSAASITEASVEIRNELTGAVTTTQTNSAGEFTFTFLPVSRYTLTISAAGFRGEKREGLELNAGGNVRLNIRLELGNVADSVSVTAETPLVNAVNAEQRTTVSTAQIRELPASRRDWTSLLRVNTGIAVSDESVTMNGMAPSGFSLTVDGTAGSSDTERPSLSLSGGFNTIKAISLEAIEEVLVAKGIAPAEVGSMLSGNVNVITKSGTNDYHGSVFFNNQLEDYNARNQFLPDKPGRTFNQYGGSVGGPILRNRLFFFGTYEGYQNRAFATVSGNVPTPEFKALAIAAVPAYKDALDVYPLPNRPYAPGATNALYQGANSNTGQDNHAVARADYQISSRDLLTARYTRSRPDQIEPRVIAINPRSYVGTNEVGTLSFTHSLASWVFASRFGYSRVTADRVDGLYTAGIADLRGAMGFNAGGGEVLNRKGDNISFEQTAAWTGGRHTVKFGGLFNRIASGRQNVETPRLTYSTLADFYANIPGQFRITFGIDDFSVRMSQTGFFIQDDYKLARNFILNVGLRYDYWGVPRERDGRLFNRSNQGFGAYFPPDESLNPDRNNFAPRVGFAWTLDNSGKTVVRAGAGTFYTQRPIYGIQELVLTSLDQPFRANLTRADGIALNLRYPFTNEQALQALRGYPDQSARTAFEPNFPNPYSMQWMLSVQRQLPWSAVFETAYVANRVLKLNLVLDQNLPNRITGVRPVAGVGGFRLYQPADRSKYDSLQTSIRQRLSSGLLFSLHHTWSSNLSYSDGDLGLSGRPQDNNNIAADWGPTPYARRHRFVGEVLYEVPFLSFRGVASGLWRQLAGGWQAGSIVSASTGGFTSVTQPTAFEGSRADFLGGSATLPGSRDTLAFLDPRAFAPVPISQASGAAIRGGTVGRNAIEAPGSWTVDLSLAKSFMIREGMRFQIRADAFNAFNHRNLGGLQTNITANNFGRLTSAGSRSVQLNARLTF